MKISEPEIQMTSVNEGQLWLMKALEVLPKPFFILDYQSQRVTFSNAAARRMLGLDYAHQSVHEFYGKDLKVYDKQENFVPLTDLPSARILRGEKVQGEEFLLVNRIGRFNIKCFSEQIPGMFGQPPMAVIIFQDITALKNTETELRRAQAGLREAVQIAQIGFWSMDITTGKTELSQELMTQFGLESFDGRLETAINAIHPDDRARVTKAIDDSITNGTLYRIEYRVVHPDGTIRWVEAKSGPVPDQSSDRNHFSGTTLDITERVRARQKLEANERELKLLADSMPQIVWSALPSGELDYFNKVWFDFSGSDYDENRGSGWAKFVHPEDLPVTLERWEHSLKTSEPYENEFRLRAANGEYRWHIARARPIFEEGNDGQSKVKKWYGTNADIHDQKLLNDKLKEAREAAERANSAKSVFLANMSHEIRTPLGAIMGFAELIKENALGRKQREEYASVIERNSSQLLRIVDDILDLSKVEAGMMLIESIEFSLPEALTDFASLMGFKAREKGIHFSTRAKSAIPATVMCDPTRLRQILMNVVGNAIKFTEHGKVELCVSYDDGHLEFEVTDTGRGISDEQRKHLFKPFSQADTSTTRKYGGTGLGLVLTRGLAEAMGGHFVLTKSELGVGSVFNVRIKAPAASTQMFSGLGFLTETARTVTTFGQLANLNILLVEDSPDNQALISIYLSRAGARIEIAADGESGYQKALAADYDLVLMDVQMPIMDGIAAVKKLRSEGYKKPIIALTAHAMKEERERCLKAGFTDFISKPINREELITMILARSSPTTN